MGELEAMDALGSFVINGMDAAGSEIQDEKLREAQKTIDLLREHVAKLTCQLQSNSLQCERNPDTDYKDYGIVSEAVANSRSLCVSKAASATSRAEQIEVDLCGIFDVGFVFNTDVNNGDPLAFIESMRTNHVVAAYVGTPMLVSRDTGCAETISTNYDVACYNTNSEHSLFRALCRASPSHGGVTMTSALFPMCSGFDPRGAEAVEHIDHWVREGCSAVGPISVLDYDTSNCVKGEALNLCSPSMEAICNACVRHGKPLFIKMDALVLGRDCLKPCTATLVDLDTLLLAFPSLPVVWHTAGYCRLMTSDVMPQHLAVLQSLLHRDNLMFSFTPEMLEAYQYHPGLLEFAANNASKIVLASGTKATNVQSSYSSSIASLRTFLGKLPEESRPEVARLNASTKLVTTAANESNESKKCLLKRRKGRDSSVALNLMVPTPKKSEDTKHEQRHNIIDTHLHIFDFMHKTEGIKTALQLMDQFGVPKACALSMSHHKKWRSTRRRAVQYYGEDTASCYVYAYTDQLLMDEILTLDAESQKRFAPFICGFDPTDMSALDHVKRMHEKYPNKWAGIGEIFFRHDDLTNLSMGRDEEIPRPDHPAMCKIYEYCMENKLAVLMHHNLYASGSTELRADWVHQFETVLEQFPDLTLVLCHTGISRLCWDKNGHHEYVDRVLSKFPSLMMDISWVVYECVICDQDDEPKPEWLEVFEKHKTRFLIGSDQVGKFSGSLRLAQKIKKYSVLLNRLSDDAAACIAQANAERLFFCDPVDTRGVSDDETRIDALCNHSRQLESCHSCCDDADAFSDGRISPSSSCSSSSVDDTNSSVDTSSSPCPSPTLPPTCTISENKPCPEMALCELQGTNKANALGFAQAAASRAASA